MHRALLLATLLLAGCLEASGPEVASPPGSGSGSLIAPRHGENETDGFLLEGNESASGFFAGDDVTFAFHAVNRGADAMAVFDPCGAGNPQIAILSPDGNALDLEGPRFRCMAAMGWGPFAAGAALWRNLTWNGSYYDDGWHVAPPGQYEARATFFGQRDGREVRVEAGVPVFVLSPDLRGRV